MEGVTPMEALQMQLHFGRDTDYVGLRNRGGPHYFNSLLLALYHIPLFRRAVYHLRLVDDDKEFNRMSKALKRLYIDLKWFDCHVETLEVIEAFGWDSNQTNSDTNVQEFNNFLLQKIDYNLKNQGTGLGYAIDELFQGHYVEFNDRINAGNNPRQKLIPFYGLHLKVTGCRDVYDSFDIKTKCGGHVGDQPNELHEAEKRVLFNDFPPVLQLYLQQSPVKGKDQLPYLLPLKLDLDRKMRKYFTKAAKKRMRVSSEKKKRNKNICNEYKLHSVLVGSGGLHGGDHYALIRPNLSKWWYKFDDTTVTKVDTERALQLYGREGKKIAIAHPAFCIENAYMLVYIRESDEEKIICDVVDPSCERYSLKNKIDHVGLQKHGGTGYLNSVIQMMYHIPCFRMAVYNIPQSNNKLAEALKSLFVKLMTAKIRVSTKILLNSFGWDPNDYFAKHEVHEFIKFLGENLEEMMEGTVVEDTMQTLFVGHCISFIDGTDGDSESRKNESFNVLQLDVEGCSNVYNSLDKYVNNDHAGRQGLQGVKKRVLFSDFPPVLLLHLEQSAVKINDNYECPLQLDLQKYLAPEANENVHNLYNLQSVLVHCSASQEVPYYSFIRTTVSNQWYKFDDETVTPEFECNGEKEANPRLNKFSFEFTKDSSPCMLVYVRESDKERVLCNVDAKEADRLILTTSPIPESKNWRSEGVLPPVRDQGKLGICWAMAAKAAIEARYSIKMGGEHCEISVQDIWDNNEPDEGIRFQNYGSFAHNPWKAFEYVKHHGVALEKDYPFKGERGIPEKRNESSLIRIEGYVRTVEYHVLSALESGPVVASINVTPAFECLTNEIFMGEDEVKEIHIHSVVIVDWGYDEELKVFYYWVLNSWGTQWGMNGFGKVCQTRSLPPGQKPILSNFVYPRI